MPEVLENQLPAEGNDNPTPESDGRVLEDAIELEPGKKFTKAELAAIVKDHDNDSKWKAENTRRSQELSAREQKYAAYEQLDSYLVEHPEKAQAIKEALGGRAIPNFDEMEPAEQVKALRQELAEKTKQLDAKINATQEARDIADATAALESEIADFKEKYPTMNEKLFLFEIAQGSKEDHEEIAKRIAGEFSTATDKVSEPVKQKIINDYLKSKDKKPVTGAGGGSAPTPKGEGKGLRFDDGSLQHAMADTLDRLNKETGE